MESYIRISTLNDFVFCPKSIYFHNLYDQYERRIFQSTPQIRWTFNHHTIDQKRYSSSKEILQWIAVYSEKYQLAGKIDIFHIIKKSLIERKTYISKVYLGQIYQLYGQYFCLSEMGYDIKKLKLYSMKDNQVYNIPLPSDQEVQNFELFLKKYKSFDPRIDWFIPNPKKCQKCIYAELCDSNPLG